MYRKPAHGKSSLHGVVSYCIHQATVASGGKAAEFGPTRFVEIIHEGLPVTELEDLQESLDVPMETLAVKLGISKTTLHRRKASGKLDTGESDRVIRFARILGKAVQVMESEKNARNWMRSPQVGLGGATPFDYIETEVGAREVEDLLGRIEYGVYS